MRGGHVVDYVDGIPFFSCEIFLVREWILLFC